MAVHRSGQIILDSPKHVYYSGTVIAGCVELQFANAPVTLFSALQVTIVGEAVVKWTEQESETYNGNKRYKDVDYLGQEEYVNITETLAGGYNNEQIQLPSGTHKYPFQLQIPPNVPSTFRGERGTIQYIIKASLTHQGNPVVNEMVHLIEVVSPFNLNFGNPKVKEPIEFLLEDDVCGCFCSSNVLSITIRLPVSGYCPGQAIPVEIQIDNQSSVEVRKIILQLFKKERYVTQRPQSEFISPEEILLTVNKGAVLSGPKRTFTVPVAVPDMIAPNLENCSIIDVGYFFRATVKLSGCNSDMTDESEICLGLVPLTETVTEAYVHPMAHCLPDGPFPDPVPIQETLNNFNNIQVNAFQNNAPMNEVQPGNMYQMNTPMGDTNSSSYYRVQVNQSYSSSDPSKNYNYGFTMTGPGAEMTPFLPQNTGHMGPSDLRISLPPYPVQNAPSAPPTYLINK